MTTCPRTMLAIPECSCPCCHEGQLRRFQPQLLETMPAPYAEAPAEPVAELVPRQAPARPPGEARIAA